MIFEIFHHPFQRMEKVDLFDLLEGICALRGFQVAAMAEFFCDQRTDAGQRGIDRFGERHGLLADACAKCFFCNCLRIIFVLRFRDKVIASRQYFTYRTHLCRDMLDRIQDHAVLLTENDIAVFAHQLDDQKLAADIPKLIQMLDLHV